MTTRSRARLQRWSGTGGARPAALATQRWSGTGRGRLATQRWSGTGGARQAALATLLCALVAGCGGQGLVGYVAQQGWQQLKILHNRQPIERVLRQQELPAGQRAKLALVLTVRDYAQRELGLRKTAAYTYYYDTGGRPLAYNLSACPKTSLRPKIWRFPIVGSLPYLGFFEREEGLRRQRELERQGLDTYLRPVPAFSSLGWFADPVYSPMLQSSLPRLMDVVIHETTHSTIFLRGQVAFNESLAVFVGNQGTLDLLARLYGPASEEVRRYGARLVRRRRFARLVSELYRQLKQLYGSRRTEADKLRRRQQLFSQAQQRYRAVFPRRTWGSFATQRLNNAVLLSYGRYNQGLAFHRAVYRRLGSNLPRLIALYKRAQQFDDPVGWVARHVGLAGFVHQRM